MIHEVGTGFWCHLWSLEMILHMSRHDREVYIDYQSSSCLTGCQAAWGHRWGVSQGEEGVPRPWTWPARPARLVLAVGTDPSHPSLRPSLEPTRLIMWAEHTGHVATWTSRLLDAR